LRAVDPVWAPWIEFARERGVAIDVDRFRRVLRVTKASIFALPAGIYDSVTSFFCAEGITEDLTEFRCACTSLVTSLRPGGLLAAAFTLGNTGYDTPGAAFPAVSLSLEDLEDAFATTLEDLQITWVPDGDGIRPGLEGMAYLLGRRRA
jgi:hypothetical protein